MVLPCRSFLPVFALAVTALLVAAGGCPGTRPAPEPPHVEPPGPGDLGRHDDLDEPDEPEAADADLPPCDFYPFSCGGQYDAVVSRLVDLDGDGVPEWIIGYQCNSFDDLDFPADPAYFTFAKLDAQRQTWEEWFNIPAGDGEGALDEDSIPLAEDLSGDGHVEVVLVMYGFGVSSRPENVYVYSIRNGGSEEASRPCPIPTSSDDTIVFADVDPDYPGKELLWAQALHGDEAHAEPHRYRIITLAWLNGLYREVDSWTTKATHAGGGAALEDAFGFEVE